MIAMMAASSRTLPLLLNSPSGANGRPEDPVRRMESALECNIALFEGKAGAVALITIDALFVGPTLTVEVRDFARSLDGDLGIWISASHTHRAPALDFSRPKLGRPVLSQVEAFAEMVCEQLGDIVLTGTRYPVTPYRSTVDLAGLSVHRRRPGRWELTRQGVRRPPVKMAADPTVPVQELASRTDWVDRMGHLRAVMWHWACHPTAFPHPDAISSDFVGVVRRSVRSRDGDVPILYLQGFAGDIRPPAVRSLARNPVRRVLQGQGFRPFSDREYRRWAGAISQRVSQPDERVEFKRPSGAANEDVGTKTYVLDPSVLTDATPSTQVTCQVVTVPSLRLVGLSAEPCFALVSPSRREDLRVRCEIMSDGDVWFCGYIDDVFGYLPTLQQYAQGGYEVDGFRGSFNCGPLKVEGIGCVTRLLADVAEA